MSRGEIMAHLGEGKYRVIKKLAAERIQQELEQIGQRLSELAIELPAKKLDLLLADESVNEKAQDINQAIPALIADEEGARAVIKNLQLELVRLKSTASQLRLSVVLLIAEDLSMRKRQNLLQQVPEGKEVDAWCADYSLELQGDVGLADINDEGGQGLLIRPGFDDAAIYSPTLDGALFPNLAQSSAQAYLNAALLPGVQRWRPNYRIGTIGGLLGDSCDVSLDEAKSSAQGLNINSENNLTDVPIHYMDCNGAVFAAGDRVIVEMQGRGWQEPRVIGFENNPRECGSAYLFNATSSYCSIDYNGNPFRGTFYKLNFRTYEIEIHSEVNITSNTLLTLDGYYIHEREPYVGIIENPGCEFSYGQFADYGIFSAKDGFSHFNSPSRGVVSPAKIFGSSGVGIDANSYLLDSSPDFELNRLVFFDLDTLSETGSYYFPPEPSRLILDKVVANEEAIIVKTVRLGAAQDGLMSFDRDMNLIARYDYGSQFGTISGIAVNSRYVFAVMPGPRGGSNVAQLFVHDAKTLAIVYTMALEDGRQKLAATNTHIIICSKKSEFLPGEDGRTEIYKISDDSGFSLDLKKTAYWFVADQNTIVPIA